MMTPEQIIEEANQRFGGLIMPHPAYAWMGWICILNPAEDQYFEFMNYVEEAYELAKEKFAKRCL